MTAVAETAAIAPDTEPGLRDIVFRMQQLLDAPEVPAAPPAAEPPASLSQDPELVSDFIMESREHLSGIEAQLLALEQDPRNLEAINTIFRGFHTIKGLAGFLDFSAIQRFAHEVETLLDLARNSKAPVDSTLVDIILQSADHMTQCLLGVETGVPPVSDVGPLVARIREMIAGGGKSQADPPQPASLAVKADRVLGAPGVTAVPAATQEMAAGPRSVKVDTGKLDYLVEMAGELVIAQSLIQHDPDVITLQSAAAGAQSGAVDPDHRRRAACRHGHADDTGQSNVRAHGAAGARSGAKIGQAGQSRAHR